MPPRSRRLAHVLGLAVGLAGGGLPGAAQIPGTQFSLGAGPAVVTIDQERLFSDSAFGRAVTAEVERAVRELSEQNRGLERELAEEEQRLTGLRPELPAEEFRGLADAFDARVEEIRRTQESRGRAISVFRDTQRQRFFEAALPVITDVVVASGAVAVLDNRAIILALDQIDITDEVLDRVDAVLGAAEVPPVLPGPGQLDAPGTAVPRPLAPPPLMMPETAPGAPAALPDARPRPRPPASVGGPPLDLPPPSLGE